MDKTFAQMIEDMNRMYNQPVHTSPTLLKDAVVRLQGFKRTLLEEIEEVEEILERAQTEPLRVTDRDLLVELADWFGDIIVYVRSEAMKYGIPLEEVLSIIMDSNMSKLGADGKPIINENGKFMKGPNYWAPEEKIHELIAKHINGAKGEADGETIDQGKE